MANLVTEEYDGGQYQTAGSFSPNPAKSQFVTVVYRRVW
jgi:hypothetical protein